MHSKPLAIQKGVCYNILVFWDCIRRANLYVMTFSVRYCEYRTLFLSGFIISCFRLNSNRFLLFPFDSPFQYPVNIFVEGYAFGLCRLFDFFVQARL